MDEQFIENVKKLVQFCEEIKKYPHIGVKVELKLFSLLKSEPRIKDEIADRNLLLVANNANYYFLKHGLEVDIDASKLIHAGMIGFFRAIEKFDTSKATEEDYNFSGYADWWIRQEMEDYILSCE